MADVFSLVASQLALDYSMPLSSVMDKENHYTLYTPMEGRRRFEDNPDFFLKLAVFNGKVIATGKEEAIDGIKEIIGERKGEWILDGKSLERIISFLSIHNKHINILHPFFVKSEKTNNDYSTLSYRIIEKEEILGFKDMDEFSEAFAFDENAPDEVGVAIMENGEIAAMAGASSDSPMMWQIGVNTKPQFRGKGYGTKAVDILSNIVLERGIIPYYGTSFSHISSMRVALSASFLPMWTELISN